MVAMALWVVLYCQAMAYAPAGGLACIAAFARAICHVCWRARARAPLVGVAAGRAKRKTCRWLQCHALRTAPAEEQLQSFAAHPAAFRGLSDDDWRTFAQDHAEECRVSASFAARRMFVLNTTLGAARCMADA